MKEGCRKPVPGVCACVCVRARAYIRACVCVLDGEGSSVFASRDLAVLV